MLRTGILSPLVWIRAVVVPQLLIRGGSLSDFLAQAHFLHLAFYHSILFVQKGCNWARLRQLSTPPDEPCYGLRLPIVSGSIYGGE